MCSGLVGSKSLLRKKRKVSKQKQMFTFNFSLCVDKGNWRREALEEESLQCSRKCSLKT